uniref:ubiquitinyl hydrolase 1 n=1 Tax=Scophthalmus maximus TaxID=52904 RepID=A0A8D3D308_SCOMX
MQKGLKKYFVNMDEYLSSVGLFRKMVARDASSLFRAVSEQLYYSQNYHRRIRQDCADFMRTNRCNFEPFVEGSFEKYLERLEDPKETVGQVEIKALSQLYRRCFLIYRYPGKPATVISEDDFVDKVMLCCSINGHYDIVYPRSYPASAALCQALLYELLYTQVFGVEEAELYQAMEASRVGGRSYRNSVSMCSDVDICYDTPDDRGQREEVESSGAADDRVRAVMDDTKVTLTLTRLSLPYKVMKSLDGDVYRNLEFDVWQDTCKEMQKTDYMVFAGRQYFLGDKCQVRLEPKGKYYNAFIQEVGTHSSAVTVFIEELGEKHLVPLTDLKPVNPVPAWDVAAPIRKGDLVSGQQWGEGGGDADAAALFLRRPRPLDPAPSLPASRSPSPAPPSITWSHGLRPLRPPTPPPPPPPYSSSSSSTRFLNRHLIGPQLTYYHPGRRYYHDYDNYAFRSRRSRRQLVAALNKDCQFGFPGDAAEEPADLDAAIAYYQLDDASDAIFPPLSVRKTRATLSRQVRTPDDRCQTANSLPLERNSDSAHFLNSSGSGSEFPIHSFSPLTLNLPLAVIGSSPSSSSSSPSSPSSHVSAAAHLPPNTHTQTRSGVCTHTHTHTQCQRSEVMLFGCWRNFKHRQLFLCPAAMTIPAASPWLANELGEPLCTVVAPPPYSYDPNGSDLPRDYRVLQYYFNLGVQWYHQSCWQQQQQVYPPSSPEASYTYQPYPPYLSQEPLHGKTPPTLSLIGSGEEVWSGDPGVRSGGDGGAGSHYQKIFIKTSRDLTWIQEVVGRVRWNCQMCLEKELQCFLSYLLKQRTHWSFLCERKGETDPQCIAAAIFNLTRHERTIKSEDVSTVDSDSAPRLPPAAPQVYETGRGSHQPPSSYPESTRAGDGQTDGQCCDSPSPVQMI